MQAHGHANSLGLGRSHPITSCFASILIFSQAGSTLFPTLVAKTAYIAPASSSVTQLASICFEGACAECLSPAS